MNGSSKYRDSDLILIGILCRLEKEQITPRAHETRWGSAVSIPAGNVFKSDDVKTENANFRIGGESSLEASLDDDLCCKFVTVASVYLLNPARPCRRSCVPYTDQIRGIPALLDAPHILRGKVGRRSDR